MRKTHNHRGVTLLEMLIVIVVIGVLTSILLPALFGTRKASQNILRLNTARNLAAATFSYSNNYDLHFPYFGKAHQPTARVSYEGWAFPPTSSYFRRHQLFWASHLVPTYYSNERDELVNLGLRSPYYADDGQPESLFHTLFALTQTTAAAPAYWSGDEPPSDLGLLRNTRRTEMAYPSSKGLIVDLLLDTKRDSGDGTVHSRVAHARVAMGDGSASRRLWGVGGHSNAVVRPYGAVAWDVLSTRDGLRGRDY